MLIKLADPRPAEPAVGSWLALRGWHKMRQVGFDVGLDAGAGALEAAKTLIWLIFCQVDTVLFSYHFDGFYLVG